MSIRSKLLVNSAITILCLIGVGITGYVFIHRVASLSVTSLDEEFPAIEGLSQAEQNAWEVMVRLSVHIGATDPVIMKKLEQEIARYASETVTAVANHGQNEQVKLHSPANLKAFETEWNQFVEAAKQITEASQGKAKEQAMSLMSNQGKTKFDKALALIRSMSQDHRKKLGEVRNEAIVIRKQSAMLLMALSVVAIVISLIAGGVISRSITLPINRIVQKLSESSGKTKQASDQTYTAGKSLADTTSKQASAIEETSSSVEEMSGMTRKNADNAREAERIVKEVRQIAQTVGETMNKMSRSMKDISETGKQTQGIVKTIDEIAFQTNLLALNAAVEAARAGEAGAGFAVVADEVRNLAVRAANAAKNTNSLIEVVIKKIKEGEALAEKMSADFSQVTDSAGRASDLVGEIAAASAEQAQGIDQINTAMNEMEKMTQDSAANSEQTASIAEEMSHQSGQIEELVSQLTAIIQGKDRRTFQIEQQTMESENPITDMTKTPYRTTAADHVKAASVKPPAKTTLKDVRPQELIPLDDDEDLKEF